MARVRATWFSVDQPSAVFKLTILATTAQGLAPFRWGYSEWHISLMQLVPLLACCTSCTMCHPLTKRQAKYHQHQSYKQQAGEHGLHYIPGDLSQPWNEQHTDDGPQAGSSKGGLKHLPSLQGHDALVPNRKRSSA